MKKRKVLIFRPDNIGDVLLFSGALKHIRTLYPGDHITLAVKAHIVNLVELCPFIDACVPIDRLTWWGIANAKFKLLNGRKRLIRKVNRTWNSIFRPFSMVIYPVKSPELSQLEIIHDLKVRRVIGMAGCNLNAPQEGFPLELRQTNLIPDCLDVSSEDPWRHELLTTLDFLRFMKSTVASIDEIQPQFWLSDSDNNLLTEERKDSGQIIGLFPGGSILEKCWKPWNYREFAKMLGGTPTYVIFGSSADKELALQVELSLRSTGFRTKILNLIGKTTLRELAKSVSFCDLFISMDTSGLHMAITAGVPTIGIVGGVHYQRFVPWGDPEINIFLTKQMDCFHCRFYCHKQDFECIQGVTPDKVANAAKRLLKDRQTQVSHDDADYDGI